MNIDIGTNVLYNQKVNVCVCVHMHTRLCELKDAETYLVC